MSCVKAHINLAALQSNVNVARKYAANAKLYAVVKSNAYGHGMLQISKALPAVDGLVVARIDEALYLRQKGIKKPILVLSGVFRERDLRRACAHQLDLVVHNHDQVNLITTESNVAAMRGMTLWVKVDTGMHRLGLAPDQLANVFETLSGKLPSTSFNIMTHLANGDDVSDQRTAVQLKRLQKVAIAGAPISIANSAGIVAWPESHADIVRPGIMLYGASPINNKSAADLGLSPVMTLSSELIAINELKKGDHIGYGGEWICPKDMLVGVVAIGYGDGYPRHAKEGTPVLVKGIKTALVGRVSMDMICVDLRTVAAPAIGDEVILWGDGLSADVVAQYSGTIAYDLFCGVTNRVEFEYSNS